MRLLLLASTALGTLAACNDTAGTDADATAEVTAASDVTAADTTETIDVTAADTAETIDVTAADTAETIDVSFANPPAGYGTTPPSGGGGACTSGEWWLRGPNFGSADMTPGGTCIACHTRTGEAPVEQFAGTVFANLADADDCQGVGGVTVDILAPDGSVIATATSRPSGNFFLTHTLAPTLTSYRARLTFDGRTREMLSAIAADKGDCNSCHSATGSEGALGRIVVP